MKSFSVYRFASAMCGALLFAASSFVSAALPTAPPAVSQIKQAIDNSKRVTLGGNTNSYVTSGVDQGALADSTTIQDMWLLLKRSPEREQALQDAIQQQHDPN
jgi:hypothetical protein